MSYVPRHSEKPVGKLDSQIVLYMSTIKPYMGTTGSMKQKNTRVQNKVSQHSSVMATEVPIKEESARGTMRWAGRFGIHT